VWVAVAATVPVALHRTHTRVVLHRQAKVVQDLQDEVTQLRKKLSLVKQQLVMVSDGKPMSEFSWCCETQCNERNCMKLMSLSKNLSLCLMPKLGLK